MKDRNAPQRAKRAQDLRELHLPDNLLAGRLPKRRIMLAQRRNELFFQRFRDRDAYFKWHCFLRRNVFARSTAIAAAESRRESGKEPFDRPCRSKAGNESRLRDVFPPMDQRCRW